MDARSLRRLAERRQLEGEARFRDGPSGGPRIAILVPKKETNELHFSRFADAICDEYLLEQLTPEELQAGRLLDGSFAALIVPGGDIFEVQHYVGRAGGEAINEFVHAGGGYVGSCCGAFLATRVGYAGAQEDFGMLHIGCEFYVGKGEAHCHLTSMGRAILGIGATDFAGTLQLYYANGQTFTPAEGDRAHPRMGTLRRAVPLLQVTKYMLERSQDEFFKAGGVERYAACAGCFGSGRIILFGPHPESTARPYGHTLVLGAVRWCTRGPIADDEDIFAEAAAEATELEREAAAAAEAAHVAAEERKKAASPLGAKGTGKRQGKGKGKGKGKVEDAMDDGKT